MPKQRITKKMVLDAGFELLRKGGEEEVLVKNIAAALSCSVQPIYSYCENMETLRQELSEMAADFMGAYIRERVDKDYPFESTGKAHIAFAKSEPHLFKNCYLRKRLGIYSFEDLYAAEAEGSIAVHLGKTLGISEDSARKFHMNMIVFNTGLSFMMISTGGNFSEEELNKKLKEAYQAFLNSAKNEGEKQDEHYCNL